LTSYFRVSSGIGYRSRFLALRCTSLARFQALCCTSLARFQALCYPSLARFQALCCSSLARFLALCCPSLVRFKALVRACITFSRPQSPAILCLLRLLCTSTFSLICCCSFLAFLLPRVHSRRLRSALLHRQYRRHPPLCVSPRPLAMPRARRPWPHLGLPAGLGQGRRRRAGPDPGAVHGGPGRAGVQLSRRKPRGGQGLLDTRPPASRPHQAFSLFRSAETPAPPHH
jgi:hypothetical protein